MDISASHLPSNIVIMSIYINNTGRPLYIVEGIIVEAASKVSQIDIDGKNGTYIIKGLIRGYTDISAIQHLYRS